MIIPALWTVVMALSSLSICDQHSAGARVKGNQRMNDSLPFRPQQDILKFLCSF